MRISIIVPVHNSLPYLERCVESLLCQTGDVEIILVENNSDDNSAELCQQLSEKYNNIIFIKTTGVGVSNARNEGLKVATGDVVGFCDADDMYEKNILHKVANAFEDKPEVSIIITGIYFCSNNKQKQQIYSKPGTYASKKVFPLLINNEQIMGSVWNKFFKKEMLKDLMFDTSLIYCEDTHFVTRVVNKYPDSTSLILDIPTYYYIANSDSVTHSPSKIFDKNNDANIIVALNKIRKDCNLSKKQDNEIAYAITRLAVDLLAGTNPDGERRTKLIKEVKANRAGFIKLLYKYAFTSIPNLKLAVRRCLMAFKCK